MKDTVGLYKCNDAKVNDSLERLIVNIYLKKKDEGYQTFALSGCERGVGTTTIAINFSLATASSGWSTVLVDADIAKGLNSKKNHNTAGGVVEYLMEECVLDDIIYPTNNPHLSYIPCGVKEDDMVRLLCSSKMDDFFSELKQRYDYIIFDLPAMNTSIDTTIFSAKSDCAILIASLEVKKKSLEDARTKLEGIGAKILGVIVNQVPEKEYLYSVDTSRKKDKVCNSISQGDREVAATNEKSMRKRKNENKRNRKEQKRKKNKDFMKALFFILIFIGAMVIRTTICQAIQQGDVGSTKSGELEFPKSEIIVTSYEIMKGEIKPGSDITLVLHLQNTSKTKTVNKIFVSFTSENKMVVPIMGESGQIYIESIPAKEEKDLTVNMSISDQINTDCLLVYFTIDFYDSQFGYTTNSTYIALPIQLDTLLEVDKLTISNQVEVDQKTLVSLKYSNCSEKDDVKDLVMHVEGMVADKQKEIKLGELPAKKQMYTDTYITFDTVGEQEVSFYFTYSIGSNTYTSDTYKYRINVLREEIQQTVSVPVEDTTNQKERYVRIIACGIIIVSALVIYIREKVYKVGGR